MCLFIFLHFTEWELYDDANIAELMHEKRSFICTSHFKGTIYFYTKHSKEEKNLKKLYEITPLKILHIDILFYYLY